MRELCRIYQHSRAWAALAVAATAFALLPPDNASAAVTFKTLHTFCTAAPCDDGAEPADRLVMDQNGVLYGTAPIYGKYNGGVVFKLVPNANRTRYREYVLHGFCRKTNCPDGFGPDAGVILDVDGNLYGTTQGGGAKGWGTVFKLTRVSNGWTFSLIYSFCQLGQSCNDGATPTTGLSYAGQDSGNAWDESSPLFGTATSGGLYGMGVVYELTRNGSSWIYDAIHSFQTSSYPNEPLVDSAGNIYGATGSGGKYGGGLLYSLASGTWSETVLHNFCSSGDCADGDGPVGRLVMDASGNLFGTTIAGGSNRNDLCQTLTGGNCGVLFERTSGGTYSVLYNFCSLTNCDDGLAPYSGVIVDGSGNLFGTTTWGGAGASGEDGTVYEFSGGTESVLYSFCMQANCADGKAPSYGGLLLDFSGNLFGTTGGGGSTYSNGGTVFRLVP